MPRRRTFNRNGSILSAPAGVDPSSWANDTLLAKPKALPMPEACQCPPPQPNRLGGCRPGLRWVSHDRLEACCNNCQRALLSGRHRRRDQQHLLGLAALGPDALDLEDCVAAGWLRGDRPEPELIDPAMAWPAAAVAAAAARGPAVPDAQAHAAAVAALERDEAAMAAAVEATA